MIGGSWPSVEEDLRWKTTFGGRQRSVEDDLLWKTTFSGRQPSLDPCILPNLLCSIFLYKGTIRVIWEHFPFYAYYIRALCTKHSLYYKSPLHQKRSIFPKQLGRAANSGGTQEPSSQKEFGLAESFYGFEIITKLNSRMFQRFLPTLFVLHTTYPFLWHTHDFLCWNTLTILSLWTYPHCQKHFCA